MADSQKPKHFYHFRRREIKEEKKNSLKELLDLYREEDDGQLEENDSASAPGKDASLKNLIETNRSHRRKRLLVFSTILLFIFAGAAIAGFLYFSANKTFQNENLQLEIVAPEKIKVGETIEYLIKYKNLGDVALTKSRILFQYPHGFILEKAEPALENHSVSLGEITAMAQGKLKLTGKLVDSLDRQQKLTATLVFEPSNFHSEFSKEASLSTVLESPQIEFVNEAPATTTLGQKINIKITLKNKDSLDYEKLKLEIVYPDKFNYLSAKPLPTENNNQWSITRINANTDSEEIGLEGKFDPSLFFANEADRTKVFALNFYAEGEDNQYCLVKNSQFEIKITEQSLNATLIINGSTDNKDIELGNILTFSAIAKNNGEETYKDVTLKAIIDSQPIDILNWEKISDDRYGKMQKTDQGKEIVWTKTQVPELAEVKPNNEVMVTFSLPVKTFEQLKGGDARALSETTINTFSAIVLSAETAPGAKPIASSNVKLTLNSNVNFGVKALYYFDDGTPIGNGPYPPRAGQETKLQVFWDLSNDIHDLADLSLKATLPAGIELTDVQNVTVGEFKYDKTKREVSWTISQLPRTLKTAHGNFGIKFTPDAKDIGKLIPLLGNSTLSVKDTMTNSLIVKTKNIVTSALDQDKYALGIGTVQK